VDCQHGLVFTGREDFVTCVQTNLESMFNPEPKEVKSGKALVYSSVSGTGKTVSMLQLKDKLPKVLKGAPVVVAYLGFNVALSLDREEEEHISNYRDKGARDVLARRLAGATIISMVNPDSISDLPTYRSVYDGYEIPSAKKSIEMLLAHTGRKPIFIIAGVDEVQLLNQMKLDTSIPLGRLFLRLLRKWQHEYYEDGVRLVPLGTGIAIDWTEDPTIGLNEPLLGGDTTLISKHDFHGLVEKVVRSMHDEDLSSRFSDQASAETIIDLLAASYWPRVRLLQFWRDKDER
jgi:hypothetical protein